MSKRSKIDTLQENTGEYTVADAKAIRAYNRKKWEERKKK